MSSPTRTKSKGSTIHGRSTLTHSGASASSADEQPPPLPPAAAAVSDATTTTTTTTTTNNNSTTSNGTSNNTPLSPRRASSSASASSSATNLLVVGGGGGAPSVPAPVPTADALSRHASLSKRTTHSVAASSLMHVAAANASDSSKGKAHSPLAILRDLLSRPPPTANSTTTASTASSSSPSATLSSSNLRQSGSFSSPLSPAASAWLEARDADGATPLHCAAFAGHIMATKLLIVGGADVNAADSDGATALHKACARGHVAVVEVLMAADARRDVRDHRGQTPLHYAVDGDRASALEVLLAHDHDGSLFASVDQRGHSLLHRAASRGSRRSLARIRTQFAKLVQPATVNAADADGMTPLHHAALSGSGSCVRQLLALGADATLTCGGAAQLTAAHLAAASGSAAGLEALLGAHAPLLTQADSLGRLPIDMARSVGAKAAAAAAFLEQQQKEQQNPDGAADAPGPQIEVTQSAQSAAAAAPFARPAAMSTMEIQNVNRWGFVDPNAQQYAPTEKDIRKEVERGMKWMQMFQQWDKFAGSEKLRERVDKGIPDAVRGLAWMRLTGATTRDAPSPYADLLALPSEHAAQIKKDIHRTFPKHILFRDAGGAGQQSLFNVLKCFSLWDKATGYCQGMGFVAGVLLMYMAEEDAFWVLVKIAKNYEMDGMWRDGFPHLERGKFVLERLLQTHLKPVAQHMSNEGVMLGLVADKWFMTWFLYTMPFHVVLRIWDGLLGHGFSFIYKVMVALVKLRQNDILESPFEDIVVILKFDGEIGGQTDENKLIETACALKIKQDEIDALHAEWAASQQVPPK